MVASRLQLYNIALDAVGERELSSLSENREPRRLLDGVYARGGGAVRFFLTQGFWNHAMRSVKLDATASITTQFGYTKGFARPTDFVKLNQISLDEYFNDPLLDYEIEGNNIFTDNEPLYLRYVSDGDSYGANFDLWPETFTQWAGHWLATQIAPRLKNDTDIPALRKETDRLLKMARSNDAQQERTRFQPVSSWVRARHNQRIKRDRGSRSQLTG